MRQFLALIVVLVFSGCSPRVVEVERPVLVEQTHYSSHIDVVRDTLIMRDSVYHFVQGDTVIIERWHHTTSVNNTIVRDTIHDTIPQVVVQRVSERVEVPSAIPGWQKTFIFIGMVSLALIMLIAGWLVWRLKH